MHVLSLLAVLGVATPSAVLRPGDVLDAPDRFMNLSIEVEIVETIEGVFEYGYLRVWIPEGRELVLVPSTFHLGAPDRYKAKFDRPILAPVRVRGQFLSDDDPAMRSGGRPAYVLRVSSFAPLAREAPIRVGSLAELAADRTRWDRKWIIYEGLWVHGFEVSTLDGDIWLSSERDAAVSVCHGEHRQERVRVTGILFSKPGAHYGHLGGCRFGLQASTIECLGPTNDH